MAFFSESVRRIDYNGEILPDRYVCFRRNFSLDVIPAEVMLSISAESEYAVYLNGKRLEMTQFPDYPNRKTVSVMDVTLYLEAGENVICVLVYRLGTGCLTHIPAAPGLMIELSADNWNVPGCADWKCRLSESFAQGNAQMVTSQLGYNFVYNAAKEDDWLAVDYDDSAWQNATELPLPDPSGDWQEFVHRPIPFLKELPPGKVDLILQGDLLRNGDDIFRKNRFPWIFFPDCDGDTPGLYATPPISLTPGCDGVLFPPRGENVDGQFCIVDIGQETIGFLRLELDAPEGTFVMIHHGEHIDDGEVRSLIDGRYFCDHYTCKEGRNEFYYPFRRLGARYLELQIFPPVGAQVRLRYAGLSETLLPLPEVAAFTADDPIELRLRSTAIRTLMCCMHDHYEDCPWREQALYAYDSRNEILYGYYLWGNYRFVRTSLDLLSRSEFRKDTGYLTLTAPGEIFLTIPCFSFVWILEMAEYVLFTGDTDFFLEKKEKIEWILNHALNRKSAVDGLYMPSLKTDPGIWSFYEWTGILGSDTEFREHALYNLYLVLAFRSAARGYEYCGDTQRAEYWNQYADALGKRVVEVFYDAKRNAWSQLLDPEDKLCEHVQIMLLFLGLMPEDQKKSILPRIMEEKEFVPVTFSVLPYLADAMFQQSPETRAYVEKRIRRSFEPLLNKGLTTFPETSFAGDAFRKAGSLCHGWSAIPAWLSQAVRLGVTPLEPGFRKFRLRPWAGMLRQASGEVVTPHGKIRVAWVKTDQGLNVEVSYPANLECVPEPWEEYPFVSLTQTEE